ncbi:hypothetical protein PILCRDRAFT_800828 [Piloderma croceum F 1598]|uniref:Sugar phosphate transporter domain-containing protein n=1 Tax=Piloderma croceum (strain F 1598) TaxID=765440 RepID=A0A0C3EQ58_PILCF|nr:hypothetical protein PILCRDRAFT_800828 [Piloderma croceum F 1598]
MSLRKRSGKSHLPQDAGENAVSEKPKAVGEREVDPGIRPLHAASSLVDYSFILSLVLGGCCANVWAYEQLLNINPRIGSALTFSQTLFITIQTLPQFLTLSSSQQTLLPRLMPRQVPVRRWILQVLVHTTGSLLNNWAFAFRVPLSIQIVFRSAGQSSAVSMLFGYFFLERRYTPGQITSVFSVSVGVILTTLSRPSGPSKGSSEDYQYLIGICMLTISSLLTGVLGMLQELTYRTYGPCWREGVFYTHFLSLPIFLFLVPDIKQGLGSLSAPSSFSGHYIIMAGNLVTQLICVAGVNRLTSQVSSVSTNLVLTTRKAISLCFSVWWFGNGWNSQLGVGAMMVFVGSLLFTLQ